jgi:hypothetical protein
LNETIGGSTHTLFTVIAVKPTGWPSCAEVMTHTLVAALRNAVRRCVPSTYPVLDADERLRASRPANTWVMSGWEEGLVLGEADADDSADDWNDAGVDLGDTRFSGGGEGGEIEVEATRLMIPATVAVEGAALGARGCA